MIFCIININIFIWLNIFEKSLKLNALPIGLANKLKLKNDIVEDNIITWDDVEFNINDETISYRKKMENQIKD